MAMLYGCTVLVDPNLERVDLDGTSVLWTGRLLDDLIPDEERFDFLWALHPDEFHEIKMHGRLVKTPRWQQAYGADYVYTGNTNRALSTPPALAALLEWTKTTFHPAINGLLLNWYDGGHAHYIGKHRDSTVNMVSGAPIVIVSFGDARTFRLRPYGGTGYQDFDADDGSVIVIPYETNKRWTHEVPHFARNRGRRISVTLRAFTASA